MTILVTGAAGFIGMHVALRLLMRGEKVIGLDDLNDYYDISLKRKRLANLFAYPGFNFVEGNVANVETISTLFEAEKPKQVVHMAAQAGVRYSLENPALYVQSNLVGFANILEASRKNKTEHLLYASSSSVYGQNNLYPFSEKDKTDHPVSLYAATKKSNELMAYSYSSLYGLQTTGLRYFTVYGPWGRPDMAPWIFTSAILDGKNLNIYNHGLSLRDFTYIDDVVEGTIRILDKSFDFDTSKKNKVPHRIYNIGNHEPVDIITFLRVLEDILGVKASINHLPMQPGDMSATYADVTKLIRDIDYRPTTSLRSGLSEWVNWYRITIRNKCT
jgi:UDP-glucuronate 4-epimerase